MRLLCSAPNTPCPACCAIYLGPDALISVCSALSYESTWSLWVWPCWAATKWGSCLLWCIKAELCLSSGSEKLLLEDSQADFVLVLVRHNLCLEKSYFYAVINGIFHHFIVSYVLLEYCLNIAWNNCLDKQSLGSIKLLQMQNYCKSHFLKTMSKDHVP